jgi:hypothetical protein
MVNWNKSGSTSKPVLDEIMAGDVGAKDGLYVHFTRSVSPNGICNGHREAVD